ncbi:MAG: DNA recombination protein RmuC, partial [Candidatus Accumulibacter sp.]|nr:DNA recombination protein RmuC [Accumulibacter sp.]
MSQAWLYATISIGVLLIILQLVLLLRAGTTREVMAVRLRDLQSGLERLERDLRQELSLGRQEAASVARGDRQEQSLSLNRLSQALAAQLAQLGRLQAQQLESFAQQLARLTNSNEQRFEQLRLALEARLGAMQADNA